jgi:hypothetical protein
MSNERERFEAWYRSEAFPFIRPTDYNMHGFRQIHSSEYWCSDVQEKWLTWQAATAATARECADIIDNVTDDDWSYYRQGDISDRIRARFPMEPT